MGVAHYSCELFAVSNCMRELPADLVKAFVDGFVRFFTVTCTTTMNEASE